MKARDDEILAADERINAFLLERLAVGSIGVSSGRRSGSHRSKKRPTSGISLRSSSTLSSAKACMDMRMAEVNLAAAERDGGRSRALSTETERTRAAIARLDSEEVIIQAETELAKARVRSEASQGLLDLEDEAPLSTVSLRAPLVFHFLKGRRSM